MHRDWVRGGADNNDENNKEKMKKKTKKTKTRSLAWLYYARNPTRRRRMIDDDNDCSCSCCSCSGCWPCSCCCSGCCCCSCSCYSPGFGCFETSESSLLRPCFVVRVVRLAVVFRLLLVAEREEREERKTRESVWGFQGENVRLVHETRARDRNKDRYPKKNVNRCCLFQGGMPAHGPLARPA